jgi:hypothetical protein
MPKRSPLLRRSVYLTALLSTIAVFALALNAIARTQPHAAAGAIAPVTRSFEPVQSRHHCHHGAQQHQAPASSGREV